MSFRRSRTKRGSCLHILGKNDGCLGIIDTCLDDQNLGWVLVHGSECRSKLIETFGIGYNLAAGNSQEATRGIGLPDRGMQTAIGSLIELAVLSVIHGSLFSSTSRGPLGLAVPRIRIDTTPMLLFLMVKTY